MTESYQFYSEMLKDEPRIRLWEQAIQKTVKPGDVVVEIGCGVGTFGFFAARAGAAKVYAIEADRVLDVAREVAAAEGSSQRMEFIEGYSTSVAIPEVADVVIYEDFCPFFFDPEITKILGDARRRFLKPGGQILPRLGSVHAGLFEDQKTYQEMADPLGDEARGLYGMDFTSLRELTLNGLAYQALTPRNLLAEPATIYSIDFQQETPAPFASRQAYTLQRAGTAHGLAIWFDLELAEGIHLSNRPGTPVASWQQGILPFDQPIPLAAGDAVDVEVRTVVSKFYGGYWNWTVRARQRGGARPVLLRQTSFRGQPLPEALSRYLQVETKPAT
jgi:protein arginine N-methyltransferase 1